MPRKPVDTSKPLVAMVRNPATGRYVRVNSKIGRAILPPEDLMPKIKGGKVSKRVCFPEKVEKKEEHPLPEHPDEIEEISRQLELLRQRLKNSVPASI